jgi:hypothetical protein
MFPLFPGQAFKKIALVPPLHINSPVYDQIRPGHPGESYSGLIIKNWLGLTLTLVRIFLVKFMNFFRKNYFFY